MFPGSLIISLSTPRSVNFRQNINDKVGSADLVKIFKINGMSLKGLLNFLNEMTEWKCAYYLKSLTLSWNYDQVELVLGSFECGYLSRW